MFEEFMNNYITKCVSYGYTSPAEICQCAKEDIEFLDEEINNIEFFRTRQSYLRTLIRKMGNVLEKKRERNFSSLRVGFSVSEAQLDTHTRNLCANICKIIEKNNVITIRDILDSMSNIEDNKSVYIAIKWLIDHSYLTRSEDITRSITRGSKWENRPSYNEDN